MTKPNCIAFVSLALMLGITGAASAQQPLKYCSTNEETQKLINKYPDLLDRMQLEEIATQKTIQRNAGSPSIGGAVPTEYIIPIVFHVLHEYGPEDISDAQIQSEMVRLNLDYNKLNADTTGVIPQFQNLIGNAHITFRLATIDPNGNPTTGIDRIVTTETYNGDDGSKLNQWPPNMYLNVWTVANINSGAAGYAYYPSSAAFNPSIDGVMILSTYIGNIGTGTQLTSRALTHEIGHTLNLIHPWGGTNQPGPVNHCSGSDNVSDTPETNGYEDNCPTDTNQAKICNPHVVENYQNYMDYAYCSPNGQSMFTKGQVTRMITALTSSTAGRNNLYTTSNLIATGTDGTPTAEAAPIANFTPYPYTVCSGTSLTFTDMSSGGKAVSWKWICNGGTPNISTVQDPVVQYNNPGTYAVTLVVTDSSGTSDSITRTAMVNVSPTTGNKSVPYIQDFESTVFPDTNWIVVDKNQGNHWQLNSTLGYKSKHCVSLTNNSGQGTGIDAFYLPTFDFSKVTGGIPLLFEVAYAEKKDSAGNGPNLGDNLRVYISGNCGETWTPLYSKTGKKLSTIQGGALVTGNFTPKDSTQWRKDSISAQDLNFYYGKSDIRFKFEYNNISGYGNNIYIDNIELSNERIAGSTGIAKIAEDLGVEVFPNPTNGSATVNFTLSQDTHLKIVLNDILGRVVSTITDAQFGAGEQHFNISQQPAGLYFINIYVGDKMTVKKIIFNQQ